MRLWILCIYIDTNTGFKFNGDVVIPDGYLFDLSSHRRFVKFGEVSSLLCDVILQVIDTLYLLISCSSVYGGLPVEFPKSDISSAIFVISFFDMSLPDELLLQGRQLFVDVTCGT